MMPSELTSVSPCSTALSVWVLDTLNAGIANPVALAVLSISAYRSGVATGMAAPLRSRGYGLSLTMVGGAGWWGGGGCCWGWGVGAVEGGEGVRVRGGWEWIVVRRGLGTSRVILIYARGGMTAGPTSTMCDRRKLNR